MAGKAQQGAAFRLHDGAGLPPDPGHPVPSENRRSAVRHPPNNARLLLLRLAVAFAWAALSRRLRGFPTTSPNPVAGRIDIPVVVSSRDCPNGAAQVRIDRVAVRTDTLQSGVVEGPGAARARSTKAGQAPQPGAHCDVATPNVRPPVPVALGGTDAGERGRVPLGARQTARLTHLLPRQCRELPPMQSSIPRPPARRLLPALAVQDIIAGTTGEVVSSIR